MRTHRFAVERRAAPSACGAAPAGASVPCTVSSTDGDGKGKQADELTALVLYGVRRNLFLNAGARMCWAPWPSRCWR
jgi:hypothetical protein